MSPHQFPPPPERDLAALGLSIVLWSSAVLYSVLLLLFFYPIARAVFS